MVASSLPSFEENSICMRNLGEETEETGIVQTGNPE